MTHTRLWIAIGALAGLTFACNIPNSVDIGGECIDRQMCKSPSDACLSVDGNSYCSKMCSAADPCPGDLACVQMDVTMQNAAGFHELPGMGYCLPTNAVPQGAPVVEPLQ